ncbi:MULTISPECIES: ABC transporter ATP-binding protein [unclassified Corynebacterium]|uniref:ABC transporter ATP-binding protein n=1 Tax=unclassified Corynebacterium TaxID=2624378 RepID=UPI0003B84B67|nr:MULTISPECIES: ABC transporter ATP-binding protein [unclassified Corynebacterium]ERS56400.1 hypothetical protein HMPREF1281_00768 [Corynebacterium sp. KPL1855]ERS64265.1 hypothetical protein HMPREF1257_00767 [Corynebacterium sp. KPL1814]ERS80682.1 hypothetical protein HMPREF1285_00032 [Corynebacterium sp. KPL1859]
MKTTRIPNSGSSTAIEVRDVEKVFAANSSHSVRALNDVSVSIATGEIVALLGSNGAGKSTLIDLILGLTEPSSGAITVQGKSPQEAINNTQLAAVLQSGGLLPDLTVSDTLKMISATFAQPLDIGEVAHHTNLEPILSRRVGKCSGGEQQRLRFALALLGDPQILILDEPTAGMDPGARRDFWASMQHQAELGRTIFFATHYLEEADNFAERIVLLHKGEVVADDKVIDIRSRGEVRRITAQFDGSIPPMSALPGVTEITRTGDHIQMTTSDSDSLARHLLNHTGAYDLTISAHSLENTFLALTDEHN